jgi:hypothetical protein
MFNTKVKREDAIKTFVADFPVKEFDLSTVSGFWIICNG